MTGRKTTLAVIPEGYKSCCWIATGEVLAAAMLYPYHFLFFLSDILFHFLGNRRSHKVALEKVKLVLNPQNHSFKSKVVGGRVKKQGYEPVRRWAKAGVCETLVAGISRITTGRFSQSCGN